MRLKVGEGLSVSLRGKNNARVQKGKVCHESLNIRTEHRQRWMTSLSMTPNRWRCVVQCKTKDILKQMTYDHNVSRDIVAISSSCHFSSQCHFNENTRERYLPSGRVDDMITTSVELSSGTGTLWSLRRTYVFSADDICKKC